MVDGPIDDQNPEDEQPEIDPKTEEQQRAGLDYLTALADERADQRITAYFSQNWPAMMDEIANVIAQKIDPEKIAARAEQIFATRWNEAAGRRQAAAAGGGGGGNGPRPTASGSDGRAGDDDVSFLKDMPDGDPGNQAAASMRNAADRKQAVAIGGLRMLEDPIGTAKEVLQMYFDVKDHRRPNTPPRNDLDVIEDLARRRPWLIDTFASQDPMSAPEKLANAMMAGANSGLRLAEAVSKHDLRRTTSRRAPTFKPPKIEVEPTTQAPVVVVPANPTPPTPAPEPAAVMAQDPPPARRRRRLQDAV